MADAPHLTSFEAFEMLLVGNQRFVEGAPQHPNQDAARRRALIRRAVAKLDAKLPA